VEQNLQLAGRSLPQLEIRGEMTCRDSKLGLLAEKVEAGPTFASKVDDDVQFWMQA